jgi:hypothetical protein
VSWEDWQKIVIYDGRAEVVRFSYEQVIRLVGLVVSFDDPHNPTERQRWCIAMDWSEIEVTPQQKGIRCDDPEKQKNYNNCLNKARIDFDACQTKNDNNFDKCIVGNSALTGALGGLLGCLVGTLGKGVIVPAGWVGVLIGCAAGALILSAVAALKCYTDWIYDDHNCHIDFDRALGKCNCD